jgi:hypothetical protein
MIIHWHFAHARPIQTEFVRKKPALADRNSMNKKEIAVFIFPRDLRPFISKSVI